MKQITPPDYLQIPYLVYANKNLDKIDGIIYAIIYWFDKLRDGRCVASNQRISEIAKCTPGTVANSLVRLEKEQCIKRIFHDEEKKKRKQIIPLVFYARVSSTDDTVSSTDDTRVSSTDEQKKKSTIKKKNKDLADGQKINYFLGCFKKINPSFHLLFANSSQRAAAARLIGKYDLKRLEIIIDHLRIMNQEQFAKGKSITPIEIEKNLAHIINHYNQNKNLTSQDA